MIDTGQVMLNRYSLRALRQAKGLGVGDLARKAGVQSSTVSNLENGTKGHRASWAMVIALAEALEVPPTALAAPDEEPTFDTWPAGVPRRGGTKSGARVAPVAS